MAKHGIDPIEAIEVPPLRRAANYQHLAIKAALLELKRDHPDIREEDLYLVWFCKTLQNWKALISTDYVCGLYVETTYNGNDDVCYVDIYRRRSNAEVPITISDLNN